MKLATLTLNQYDKLDLLLRSAERGSVKPTGYILLDNGGHYDIQRARDIIKERVPIDFIAPGKNIGVAPGWNVLLEKDMEDPKSTGLVISNDDIVLGPSTFEQLVEGLQRSDFVGCAGGWALFGQSRRCTQTVGWYDENFINAYYEDCDYYLRLHEANIDILDLGWGSGVGHAGSASTHGATPEQLRAIQQGRISNYAYFILKWGSGSPRWGNPHVKNFRQAFDGKPPPGWSERLSESSLHPNDLVSMRWDVVNHIAKTLGAQRYLEIGVAQGDMIRQIQVEERWGVDPYPRVEAVQASSVFIPQTSDIFFEKLAPQLGAKFDLVFIDGDHRADQVYREVQSAIQHLSPGGMICLHDCCPFNEEMQEVPPRSGGDWTGDVWKAVVRLRAEGEHLVRVINSDYGIGLVLPHRGSKIKHASLLARLDQLGWNDLQNDRDNLLGILQPWEWKSWLADPQSG